MKLEFKEGQRVLITGHKGFIGGHLWHWLQDYTCYSEWQNTGVDLYGLDFPDDIGFFKPPEKKYDCVIHLAAIVPINLVNNDKKKAFNINYIATKNLYIRGKKN